MRNIDLIAKSYLQYCLKGLNLPGGFTLTEGILEAIKEELRCLLLRIESLEVILDDDEFAHQLYNCRNLDNHTNCKNSKLCHFFKRVGPQKLYLGKDNKVYLTDICDFK
jgi:hypothetical protein